MSDPITWGDLLIAFCVFSLSTIVARALIDLVRAWWRGRYDD